MNKVSAVESVKSKEVSVTIILLRYVKAFLELGKFRLSLSVAFSAIAAYFLSIDVISWYEVTLLGIGGLLLAMSANSFNQYLERDIDAIMERTIYRPLVTGILSVPMALGFTIITLGLSLWLLGLLCWCAVVLGALAWLTYIVGYTYLKRKTPRAVELGSISGALPAAIGVLVANPNNWLLASLLFLVQFIWQYPHTWIILKLYEKQYQLIGTKIKAPKRFVFALFVSSILPPLIMIPVGVLIGIHLLAVAGVSALLSFWIVKKLVQYRKSHTEKMLRKVLVVNLLMLPLNYAIFILLKFLGI